MPDPTIAYAFGLLMLAACVVGGIAAGRWFADRTQAKLLWLALTMWAMGPVLGWLCAQYVTRAMGLQGDALGWMALQFLVPDLVFVMWCLAAYFEARRATSRLPGRAASWVFGLAGLVVTAHGVYAVFFPTLHSYGFIR